MTNRGNELSAADRQALDVLIACNVQLQESLQALARIIAAEQGVALTSSQTAPSDKLKRRVRDRRIIARDPGGFVVDDDGEIRHFSLKRTDDGVEVEELDAP